MGTSSCTQWRRATNSGGDSGSNKEQQQHNNNSDTMEILNIKGGDYEIEKVNLPVEER
jgi:hypothetical protein